jgi:signal transduction histidine kinase
MASEPSRSAKRPEAPVIPLRRRDRQVTRDGMRAVEEISRLIAARLDPAELCRHVLLLLAELYGYDLLAIHFYTPLRETPADELIIDPLQPPEPEYGLRLVAQIGYTQIIDPISLTTGICGRVARTRKTAYVRNVQNDPEFLEVIPGVLSEICVPLLTPAVRLESAPHPALESCAIYRGPHTDILTSRAAPVANQERGETFLGTLSVESRKLLLGPADVRLLETIARQLAIAIDNARLQQQAHERDAIAAIAARINAPFDLDDVLSESLRQISELLDVPTLTIHLRENGPDGTAVMRLRADWGITPEEVNEPSLKGFTVPARAGGNYAHLAAGRLLVANDLRSGTFPEEARRMRMLQLGIHALACLPLEVQGQQVGQLSVASTEPGFFTSARLNFLRAISKQMGLAIQKAQLLAEVRAAYERQRELDRLKDEFLVIASHELQTPLTAIQGYLHLLRDFGTHISAEEVQAFLEQACQASDQLTLMLRSMLIALELDTQTQQLQMQPVHAKELVEKALALFDPQLYREHRALQVEVDPALWVQANELRLQQVLLNLLSNALKYSPAHRPMRIACQQDGQQVRFSVQDSGPGIAPEEHPHLFERFVRLKREMDSQERGSGLGLYISRRLVEAMGGRIWVESSGIPGEGATFSFTLALAPVPANNR